MFHICFFILLGDLKSKCASIDANWLKDISFAMYTLFGRILLF